jgi:hypothetical protein
MPGPPLPDYPDHPPVAPLPVPRESAPPRGPRVPQPARPAHPAARARKVVLLSSVAGLVVLTGTAAATTHLRDSATTSRSDGVTSETVPAAPLDSEDDDRPASPWESDGQPAVPASPSFGGQGPSTATRGS